MENYNTLSIFDVQMSGFDKGKSFFNSLIITALMKFVRFHQIGKL